MEIIRHLGVKSAASSARHAPDHPPTYASRAGNAADSSAATPTIIALVRAAGRAAHTEIGLRSVNCAPACTAADCTQERALAERDCVPGAARQPASADHTSDSILSRVAPVQAGLATWVPGLRLWVSPAADAAESVP